MMFLRMNKHAFKRYPKIKVAIEQMTCVRLLMLLQCPCQLARYWRNWSAADLMECIYASLCFATFSTLFGSRSSIKQVRCLKTPNYIHVNVLSSCRLRIFWRLPRLLSCCCQSTDSGTGMKRPPDSGVWAPWPWVKDKCLSRNWSSWKKQSVLTRINDS